MRLSKVYLAMSWIQTLATVSPFSWNTVAWSNATATCARAWPLRGVMAGGGGQGWLLQGAADSRGGGRRQEGRSALVAG